MKAGRGSSLRALARRIGVSHQAISQGLRRGRIERAVKWVNGKPIITDAALAEAEWFASYDPAKDRLT